MPTVDGFKTGYFCWADAATSDHQAGRDFYVNLFGWEADDMPVPGGGTYTMFKVGGRNVAAISAQQDEERAQGIPPHWNVYVSVDDVDSFTKEAEAAGGAVLMPPFDVLDSGRMAVIADPAGAVLGLWQPAAHRGYGLVSEPGAPDWHELLSADLDRARNFYRDLFRWEVEDSEMPNATYTLFRDGDTYVAGAMARPEDMGDMPSHWTVYFNVADCDAAAARVKELGGQIYVEPMVIESVGKFAACADPQGAAFSILKPETGTSS